ncbi:hypothetical protein [Fictibacillus sp. NRS-1165]|uniref:hypothetical protein n=1 Tax=Fictibacillus sp. NRS-1165 TaxID=3144463 RepID=UPI003D21BB78
MPDPDSPTMQTVSEGMTWKDTPSTAGTVPRFPVKFTAKSRTSRIDFVMIPVLP